MLTGLLTAVSILGKLTAVYLFPRAERHAGLIEDDVLTDSRPEVYIHNSRPGTHTYKTLAYTTQIPEGSH